MIRGALARALALWGLVLLAGCSKKAEGPPDGAALFRGACARCHGENGGGGPLQGGVQPRNFRDHAFQASHTDAQLKTVIVTGKGTAMPAFGKTFSDAELASLVAYVRAFDPEVAKALADGGGMSE